MKDRKMQRALEALIQAGRADLIGNGCDALIPAQPPNRSWEHCYRFFREVTPCQTLLV